VYIRRFICGEQRMQYLSKHYGSDVADARVSGEESRLNKDVNTYFRNFLIGHFLKSPIFIWMYTSLTYESFSKKSREMFEFNK
jgi:hypothetical protein